jgi:hypothetical protein
LGQRGILNGMTGTPAYVLNARMDILAANDLCLALYVRLHRTARKRLANRVVGEIELTGDALDMVGDRLTMIASKWLAAHTVIRYSCSCDPRCQRGTDSAPLARQLVRLESNSALWRLRRWTRLRANFSLPEDWRR